MDVPKKVHLYRSITLKWLADFPWFSVCNDLSFGSIWNYLTKGKVSLSWHVRVQPSFAQLNEKIVRITQLVRKSLHGLLEIGRPLTRKEIDKLPASRLHMHVRDVKNLNRIVVPAAQAPTKEVFSFQATSTRAFVTILRPPTYFVWFVNWSRDRNSGARPTYCTFSPHNN